MKKITLADKNFRLFIDAKELDKAIALLAKSLNIDYAHEQRSSLPGEGRRKYCSRHY